jgi:hypothetical protein
MTQGGAAATKGCDEKGEDPRKTLKDTETSHGRERGSWIRK